MPEPGCSLPGPIGPNLPSPRDPPPEPGFIPRSPAGLFPPPSPPREPVTPPGLPSPIRAVHPPPRPGPAVPSAPPVPSPHRAALPLPRSQPPPRSRPAAARTELPPPSCPPGRLPPPGPRCRCSRGGGRGGRWDPAVLPALHAHTCTRSGGCPGGTHVHTRVHTHTHTRTVAHRHRPCNASPAAEGSRGGEFADGGGKAALLTARNAPRGCPYGVPAMHPPAHQPHWGHRTASGCSLAAQRSPAPGY